MDENAMAWTHVIPGAFVKTRHVFDNTLAAVYCPRIFNGQLSQAAVGQYATMGFQMARELLKSLRNTPTSPLKQSKIDQCLINGYNQLCYPAPINTCTDGTWTLDENFADTIGLQAAFKAYKTWESMAATQGASDAFPAFLAASNLGKFTLDQIFLLAYGSSFCNNMNNERIMEKLAMDRKALDDNRLRGTVRSLNDFQTAFHCKAGDKMHKNAKERCQL